MVYKQCLTLNKCTRLSERYELRKQELSDLVHNPKSDYYTTDRKEIDAVLEDQDEYTAKNVHKFPGEATWSYLRENAQQDDIKVKGDRAKRLQVI